MSISTEHDVTYDVITSDLPRHGFDIVTVVRSKINQHESAKGFVKIHRFFVNYLRKTRDQPTPTKSGGTKMSEWK